MTKIKLCGMMRAEDIAVANRLNPDFVGFVFATGRRRTIDVEQAGAFKAALAPEIGAVGVFLDQSVDFVASIATAGIIDVVQLHGCEDEEYLKRLRAKITVPIIQSFRVRTADDICAANRSTADWVLLDNGAGTGEAFPWQLLAQMERPYFLAGGLTPENVGQAVDTYRPYGVDVSSGIETGGAKDPAKMEDFVRAVRAAEEAI